MLKKKKKKKKKKKRKNNNNNNKNKNKNKGHICCTAMAESSHIKGDTPALKPTTERHGTEPPNVTIDQMMDNLNEYLDKRLGIRKCYYNVCQKYNIKQSENGTWDLSDIKKAYGKTKCLRANLRRDGWPVILDKQIQQHLHKCEMDKLQRELKAEKAKVRALAEQLQSKEKDKERLVDENNRRDETKTKLISDDKNYDKIPFPTPATRMDPAAAVAGGQPSQNTSPPMDPAELQAIIVRQGALICSFQDQVEALQSQLQSASAAAHPPPRDLPAPRGESPRLAMPEKYDGSADRCRGFLRQCENFFAHQPEVYRDEEETLRGTRLKREPILIWGPDVFHILRGDDTGGIRVSRQGQGHFSPINELCQGSDSAANYAIKFRTLAAQSAWNVAALWAMFRKGLSPVLQTELACWEDATSLSQYVATAICLDNLLCQHRAGACPPVSAHPLLCPDYPRPREEAPEPMQLERSRLMEREHQRCTQMRLCYYCGGSGHLIHRCPEKPSSAQVALIDSRAIINLIDRALVEELRIPTIPCMPSLRITAIDSQPIGGGYLTHQTELLDFKVDLFHCERLAFYVTSSAANPVILGFPWLRQHDPQISWYKGELVHWSAMCISKCLHEPVSRPCLSSVVEDSVPLASGHVLRVYEDFQYVFSRERAARLPVHRAWD
ncbi:hypothetical protein QTP86_030630 [Hemibagrus guttatus]|nr:hypothetical protein QTP86_030630 [Hemibagrus guttatus]